MWLTWRQRLIEQSEFRDINNWPPIDLNTVSANKRSKFLRNQRIVAQALLGKEFRSIATENNVDPSRVSALLSRALAGPPEDPPPGLFALIPGTHIRSAKRRCALSEFGNPRGAKGSFSFLLESVPNLKLRLDLMIEKSIRRANYAQNITPKIVHAEFKRLLQEANWPRDRYPYTEESEGYESVRKYLNQRIKELSIPKSTTRIILPSKGTFRAMREIEIDEQTLDVNGRINLVLNDEMIPLRVSRLHLILAIDSATRCILGYHLSLTPKVNQFDMLSLINTLLTVWQPMEISSPGLAYTPGSCFPSHFGGKYTRLGIGIVRLDNALVHLAHRVRDRICGDLCATLNLGLPAHPKGRTHIEHAFDVLNAHTHRYASSTGSGITDPNKESRFNSKKPPMVTLRSLEEALSVVLTNQNVLVQSHSGNWSPLEQFRHQIENSPVRLLPPNVGKLGPFIEISTASIKQIVKEHRRPHINFEYARYVGPAIDSPELVNQKVTLKYDCRDIRSLDIYTRDGKYLGKVKAQGGWQRYAHGVTTRRAISRESRKLRLSVGDPLGAYFSYLLDKKDSPNFAKELVRVYREFGTDRVEFNQVNETIEPGISHTNHNDVTIAEKVIPTAETRVALWYSDISGRGNDAIVKPQRN